MSTSRRQQVRIQVYNPSHLHEVVPAYGTYYEFPPNGIGRCICAEHNIKGQENNVGVHAIYEHVRDEQDNRILLDKPLRVAAEGTLDADAVADFIVSDRCRGDKGFIRLDGTPEENEAAKRAADQRSIAYYGILYDGVIAAWEAHVVNFRAANPSAAPPRRPPAVALAYEFRRKNQLNLLGRGSHICGTCGADNNSAEDLAAHTRLEHPEIATMAASAAAAVSSHLAVPPPAGAPPAEAQRSSIPAGLGTEVFKTVEELEIPYSPADRKCLLADDEEVIAHFVKQIKAKKSHAAKAAQERLGLLKPQPAEEPAPAPAA